MSQTLRYSKTELVQIVLTTYSPSPQDGQRQRKPRVKDWNRGDMGVFYRLAPGYSSAAPE